MQHTWSEFKIAVLKSKITNWQAVSDRLNVPRRLINQWAIEDCVPSDAFTRLKKSRQ